MTTPLFSSANPTKCSCKYVPADVDNLNRVCGVDSDCVNRARFIECTPEFCSQVYLILLHLSIQNHMNALFDIIRAPNKYFGLKALKPIKKGSFIVEPIETPVEVNNLEFHMDKYMSEGLWRTYFPPSDTSEINNAAKKGRLSRFIAHSRNPNCHKQEWLVGNQTRAGIFASRDISDGDELTIDYTESSIGYQRCYVSMRYYANLFEGLLILTYFRYGKPRKVKEHNGTDVTPEEAHPLEDNQGIFNYIGRMLQAIYRPDLAIQVLRNLEITTDENVLRKFLNLDGLKILSLWFHEHTEPKLIERIISVLEKLPLQYNDLGIMTEIKGSLQTLKINDDGLHDRITRDKILDRDKSHSPKKSDKVKTVETCSEKKQKTPEPSSSLGCTSLLPASTSPLQPSNEEPGSSHVTNANLKANNVELVDDAPIQPPSVTASDESSSTRTFDKDKFRGEFAAAVVEYSERFKSQIDERTLTKHCIELCFGKEMRLAEVESVTSGVRNRIAKFLD
ncbi:17388_t:CDS:10, partial [Gigaspora margarita]